MSEFPGIFFDAQLRALVLVGLAWGISWIVRRRSPHLERIVWRGTVLGLLAIPALSLVTPPIPIVSDTPLFERTTLQPLRAISEPFRIESPSSVAPLLPSRQPVDAPAGGELAHTDGGASPVVPSQSTRTRPSRWRLPSWELCLMTVWLCGVALLGMRFLAARRTRRKLHAQSLPAESSSPSISTTVDSLRKELRIRQEIDIRLHRRLPSPLCWGWRRPVIMLPIEATRWNASTLRMVLAHELNHFAHFDPVHRLLGELALIAYWINPFVWVGIRQSRLSEEQATDAAVLNRGEDPARYANLLVQFARGDAGEALAPSAFSPMAQPSTVTDRVESILRSGDRFAPPRRTTRVCCGLFIASLALLAGGLAFRAQSAAPDPQPAPANDNLLYTRVFPVNRAVFSARKDATAADLIWKERGLIPPPGASAVYNQGTSQLIIRTTQGDFKSLESGLLAKWREQEAAKAPLRDVEVRFYQLPFSEARRIAKATTGTPEDGRSALEAAHEFIRRHPGRARLEGSVTLRPLADTKACRARSGISHGNGSPGKLFDAQTALRPTGQEHRYELQVSARARETGATLSVSKTVTAQNPVLFGLMETPGEETSIAVFATLRSY